MKKYLKSLYHALRKLKKARQVPIIVPVDKENMLHGKIALITGGSSGIGLTIAKSFLQSGAKVIIASSSAKKLEEARTLLNKSDRVATFIIDVNDADKIKEKLNLALDLYPEHKVDILVNSAGVHHTHDFTKITVAEYDKIMNINLRGTFFMCQAVCEYMKANQIKGHILNLSSSSALRPQTGPYHLSKAAITGLTRGLARLYQPYGIVVNAIAPGQTATPMLGGAGFKDDISNDYAVAGRYIMPEEIASLATFMVSGSGDMIVGDTFYVTGGSGIVTYDG